MTAPSIPLQHLAAAKKDTALSLLLRHKGTAQRRAAAAAQAVLTADAAILSHLAANYPAESVSDSLLGVDVE